MRTTLLRIPAFFIIATGIVFISFWLMTSAQFEAQRNLLAIGSSIDIAVIIPLTYFLLIRKTAIPNITVIPVFIVSLILGFQIIPQNYQQTLNSLELLVAPIELGIIGFLIYKVIQVNKKLGQTEGGLRNFPERIRLVLQDLKVSAILTNVATTEVSLFYYAFAGWKKPQTLQENEFSNYRESGYSNIFILVLFLLPVETFVLHYWLSSFSSVLAWVLTGLSLYSLFFIFGDRNALHHRPVTVSSTGITLLTGIRWEVVIPFELIEKIELREGDEHKEKFVNLSAFGHGNVVISLKEKVVVKGIYGIKKSTDKLVLSIDDNTQFFELIPKRINE